MKVLFHLVIGCALFIGITLTLNTPVLAQARIDAQVMVPKTAGVGCRVGPNGMHIACVAPKGSHSVIFYDGVEQPRFDALLLSTGSPYTMGTPNLPYQIRGDYDGPVVYSPDGEHWAYAARQGDNYVVLLDGKQIDSGPYSPSVFSSTGLVFSPAGNHLYYMISDNIPNNTHMRFMIDGHAEPWSKGLTTILFSPDGNHYVYTGVADDNTTQWTVIDGKQIHYIGDKVQFTDTGHLLSVYYDNDAHVNIMIADGKAVMKALAITQIWISPKGTLTLASIQVNNKPVLTVNRQLVPGTAGLNIRGVYFSPDGQHYAALCNNPTNNTEFILEDGKKGQEYPSINNSAITPMFSPDSTKFLYVAQSGSQNFLVINGDESDGFQDLAPKPVFTPDGKHMAYGLSSFGAPKYTVYVDGKALPVYKDRPGETFNFSLDGSRYAFTYGGFNTLVIDGVDVPNMGVSVWQRIKPDTTMSTFNYLFSPDSKHITYQAQDTTGGQRGLYVDQKLVFKTTMKQIDKIAFTPDSQHLVWTMQIPPDTAVAGPYYHQALYVDGKLAMEYVTSFFDDCLGGWQMQSNGSLLFYTIADDNIKRFSVTPGADTNIASLLAAADTAAKS